MSKSQEDWMTKKWRPAMGWVYMITCTTDFIIFPVLWSVLQAVLKQPVTAWQPITLQGAGLYHLAMGAIIGVAAFGRTQEKIAGASNNPTDSNFVVPPQNNFSSATNIPQNTNFDSNNNFSDTTKEPSFSPEPIQAPTPIKSVKPIVRRPGS